MIGDAIHTMTPGRGAGANTALRDARELRDRLVRVRDGELGLVEAVGEYEDLMRRYSSLAVRESLEFMNDNGHRPAPGDRPAPRRWPSAPGCAWSTASRPPSAAWLAASRRCGTPSSSEGPRPRE